jgi:alkylation response protein AidB-like acyl-CoA dehydrogenase
MFERTETQTMMVEMVDRLLGRENEFETYRARLQRDRSGESDLWPLLAEQGVLAALASEEQGGLGGSARDLACMMALSGRHLVLDPLLPTALALQAIGASRTGDALSAPLISGARTAALAWREGEDPAAALATRATATADGCHGLTGTKTLVAGAERVDDLIVTASLEGRAAVFLVEGSRDAMTREPVRLIDGTRAATIRMADTPARLLLADAEDAILRLFAQELAGLCAEAVGAMRAILAQTLSYLTTRQQFGTTLSQFQALQHRVADMHMATEEAFVLTDEVVSRLDADRGVSLSAATLAFAAAAKARIDGLARLVAHDGVQLHGGMGVSDELVVSHHFKRIARIRSQVADASVLRALVAGSGAALVSLEDTDSGIAAFRQEVAEFVEDSLPAHIARKGRLGLEIGKDDYVTWQKILNDKGWFATNWPEKHGGKGWDIRRQLVLMQESALHDAPMIIPYGVSMVGLVLAEFGTDEQAQRHLPGILSSDVWWCQGYSEPNAGSDLASLRTFAERDGDDYVVNGTKMWTTEAHWADWMHCLVRTDREVKAQAGISFLLIDMTTPGIEIRPIVTIDGQHHTNQIFFDNVRVPVTNRVGEEGSGWTIAKFLLANERVAIADTGPKLRLFRRVAAMANAAIERGELAGARRMAIEQDLVAVETELAALLTLEEHYVARWAASPSRAGPEASVLKVRGTEVLQAITELALRVEGLYGAVHDPADLHAGGKDGERPTALASALAHQYLYGRCWSIFGGTNEIQRNIIATSILR